VQNNQDKYFSFNSNLEFLKEKEALYFNHELDNNVLRASLRSAVKKMVL